MSEYRANDVSEGYCPQCGEPLSGLTVAGRGYCDQHGWTWADWTPIPPAVRETADLKSGDDDERNDAPMTDDERRYVTLETADQVDRYITDDELDEALDWFDDEPNMPTSDFLDRLFPRYGGPTDETGAELDLDSLDNEAARRIMRRARTLRKERDL